MVSYQIFSKMEEGRRRRMGRNRVQISIIFLNYLTSASALVLLLLCHWTTGEEIVGEGGVETANVTEVGVGGRSGSEIQPKSSTCSPPKNVQSKVMVSCQGYNIIPTDAPDSKDIQHLDMSNGNSLQVLEKGALGRANLPALFILNLQNCQIRTIERGAFDTGGIIDQLDLSKNRIEVLDPQVFAELNRLRFLDLRENPINRFQEHSVFPMLPSLTSLDISHCQLDDIPVGALDKLNNLKKLHLQNNELKKVSWRVFHSLRLLNDLDLQENHWYCDCHVKFLLDTLKNTMSLSTKIGDTKCHSSPFHTSGRNLTGVKWSAITDNEFICAPQIHEFKLNTYSHHSEEGQVELDQDVYFECEFEGFPVPKLTWLKNDIIISEQFIQEANKADAVSEQDVHENFINATTSSPSNQVHKPKIEIQNGNYEIEKDMSDEEKHKNFRFKENLVVRRVKKEDIGKYVCLVRNDGGQDEKALVLNMTLLDDDGFIIGGVGGKRLAIWMWLLIALLVFLILVLLTLLLCLAYRKREKKKQERFRKVVQEKFKDSNVDIGELLPEMKPNGQPIQAKDGLRPDGSTPLLDNRSENSTVLISDHFPPQKANQLPDVALGNGELIRNSDIFSPKPPLAQNGHITPSDARREFFARQISEPYLRPGSAMSYTRPSHLNASQRRYVFANGMNQSEPSPGVHGEAVYAVPDYIRTLPRSGSAMSMSAIPENDFRRQLFLRQNNQQPIYATTARLPPQHRRTPSVSSEPPHELAYLTLPRRPVPRYHTWSRPVSPTNSTCSNYSTLSWRPNVNPVTGVVSDGVGPRTGADGGSTLSLNKTPDSLNETPTGKLYGNGLDSMNRAMVMSPMQMNGGGKIKSLPRNQRLGHSRTPSSMTRGHNDFFSFEPIQEVEGSESASTTNLNYNHGGRQTPQGYSTQSLARGEPRYKKKKPPPLANIPSNLKEPSRAFDHLKGRSVSPALRNSNPPQNNESSLLQEAPTESQTEAAPSSPQKEPVIVEDLSIRKSRLFQNMKNQNQVQNESDNAGPVLESPIDEDMESPVNQSVHLPTKAPPPLPPPKPKRSQEALNRGSQDDLDEEKSKDDVKNDGSTQV